MFKKMMGLITLVFIFLFPSSMLAADAVIQDAVLEKAIHEELNLSVKTVEISDLIELKSLYPQGNNVHIHTLEGLQHAANLEQLFLPGMGVKSIEPLSELKKLNFVALNSNEIEDIQPLGDLIQLRKLVLSENLIQDASPLSALVNLTDLLIDDNKLTDISAFRGLPLRWLIISNNQIEDLTPLRDSQSLEYLYAENNRIQSLDVLLSLPSLKEVSLEGNPLDANAASVIEQLEHRGVTVNVESGEQYSEGESAAADDIKVILDAHRVDFNIAPYILDGTTFVQFRPLFEKLGISITWDSKTRTIIGEKEGTYIRLQIDSKHASVDGENIELSAPPVIVDGHTFVPLRFVSEAVQAKVRWDESSRTVMIDSKGVYTSKDGSFQITAFGQWTDATDDIALEPLQLALEYFKFTYFAVYAVPKSDDMGEITFSEYIELTKEDVASKAANANIEVKQRKFNNFDAVQISYHDSSDWDDRITTRILFETDTLVYTILHSSYKDIHAEEIKQFEEMLQTFTFIQID